MSKIKSVLILKKIENAQVKCIFFSFKIFTKYVISISYILLNLEVI